MPRCGHCETDSEAADLVRHEREGLVVVHCPDCNSVMGTWRDPAGR